MRTGSVGTIAILVALLAGCATHETYGDRTVPEAERASVEGYWRYQGIYFEDLRIVSVDGQREGGQTGWPYAASVSVRSGPHWMQVLVSRNSRDIVLCAFEAVFEGGRHYRLQHLEHDQFLLAHPAVPRFRGSVAIVVSGPSGPPQVLNAPAECSQASSCRVATDCPQGTTCGSDPGFAFGTCKRKDG